MLYYLLFFLLVFFCFVFTSSKLFYQFLQEMACMCVCVFLSRLCNTLKAQKQVLGWAPLIGTLHIKS